MIFVTVGTHEQPFNRLIECIDSLKRENIITEEVVIQSGFSTYFPQNCKWKKIYPFSAMNKLIEEARIVITHGGPSSFIMPLRVGKIPVVVPRKKDFGEHVNDHQLLFAKLVSEQQKNIIVVEDIALLGHVLLNYDSMITEMSSEIKSNNSEFCIAFERIVNEMFSK